MVRSAAIALMTAALATHAAVAHAESTDYAKEGPYGGLAIGGAFEQFDDGGLPFDFSDGYSIDGWVGVRVHPSFALEGQIEYSAYEGDFESIDLDIGIFTFTMNVKAYAMTGRIQPFGLIGLGLARVKVEASGTGLTETDFVTRFGGGVDYWVSQEWALTLSALYILPTGSLSDLQYLQLNWGFEHRF